MKNDNDGGRYMFCSLEWEEGCLCSSLVTSLDLFITEGKQDCTHVDYNQLDETI